MALLQGDPGFEERMRAHAVNGVTELSEQPADAISTITRHIHGFALYMAAATEPDDGGRERELDLLNPKITSAAFSALAYLAAEANFLSYEAEKIKIEATIVDGVGGHLGHRRVFRTVFGEGRSDGQAWPDPDLPAAT